MFKYNIEIKTPNSKEWERLKDWTRPFTDGTTLDDTLDEGCINLSCTTRSEPIGSKSHRSFISLEYGI